MKILFILLASLVVFSGCSVIDLDYRLRNTKARAALYKKEQMRKAKWRVRQRAKRKAQRRAAREDRLKKSHNTIPKAPKKHINLKKVEDDNYSAEYMYPKAKKTTSVKENNTTSSPVVSSSMTKEECIGIIGQSKFDIYTKKFGSEAATLKRCKMIKTMK